ncbi:RNA-directed DNA polymerase, eukaryota, partial [Tanacetum coccineum]
MSSQNSKQSYASAKDVHSISDKKKVSSPKCNSKVFNVLLENSKDDKPSNEDSFIVSNKKGNGGSILDALDDMIRIGQSMGYDMEGCSQDIERLGQKAKKEWIKEINFKHNINFLTLQETKMDKISHMDIKFIWGNSNYQFVVSDSVGNSGGILCVWESSVFKQDNATISDNFIALYGTWLPSNTKVLIVSIYAPQSNVLKRTLWEYISVLISRWDGETIVTGDFNEVRYAEERYGSVFNHAGARAFNHFIMSYSLVDVKMEAAFPSSTILCLEHNLSDHRPILFKEMRSDFGPTPFRTFHSWFDRADFDEMVEQAWSSFSHSDTNCLIRFKKKLQELRQIIRSWIKQDNISKTRIKTSLSDDPMAIDKELDRGDVSDELLLKRMELICQLRDLKSLEGKDNAQKAKVKWAIEGDENSKFFHGLINKKRSQL